MRWDVFVVAPLLALPIVGPGGGDGAQEEAAAAPWVVEDPTGDMYHWLARDVTAPPTRLSESADVVQLELRDENATSLTLAYTVVDLDETMSTLQSLCLIAVCYRVAYSGFFTLNEEERRSYSFSINVFFVPGLMDAPQTFGRMCRFEEDSFGECQTVPAGADYASNQVWLRLDRSSLLVGRGDATHAAGIGDALTDLIARSYLIMWAGVGLPVVYFFDDVPNDPPAPPYEFATAAEASELLIETEIDHAFRTEGGGNDFFFSGPPPNRDGIAPGEVREFGFYVTNYGAAKRIVTLTTSLEGASAGWNASAVPQVIVDANETVRIGVLVQAPPTAAHRETVPLRVEAVALGEASARSEAKLDVVVARTPSEAEPTLFLHAQPRQGARGAVGPVADAVLPVYDLRLNTQRSDAAYDDTPVSLLGRSFFSFSLDTPLPMPLALDPRGTVTLALRMTSAHSAPQPVAIDARLVHDPPTGDSMLIASGDADADLSSSGTEITVEMPVRGDETVYRDGTLVLQLSIDPDPTGIGFFGGTSMGTLDVAQSQLQLPVVPLPPDEDALAPAADLRVALHLAEGRDPVEYVNPGEARRFNVTALNEEAEDLDVAWTIQPSDRAWRVWTAGATKATLTPGNSTAFTVYALAPADAAEGDALALNVSAAPKKGDVNGTPVVAKLRVIVTRGVDLPDDAPAGPTLKAKSKDKGVPGPGLALAGLALLGALLVARRRAA